MDFNQDKILTEKDFDRMGWHDCPIYGVRFDDEILFDLDYILKWVQPENSSRFSFWIAPATLVFHKPQKLKIDVELDLIHGLEIYDVQKDIIDDNFSKWVIQTQEGDISFEASGFTQYLRLEPILVNSQFLSEEQRLGYGFDKKSF